MSPAAEINKLADEIVEWKLRRLSCQMINETGRMIVAVAACDGEIDTRMARIGELARQAEAA